MLARLSSRYGPHWLQQGRSPPSTYFCPLLLFPGDGGEAVVVEASLLLACSPLLRRIQASSCCPYSYAPDTVLLPSTTSAALHQLAQVLVSGTVTIAAEALKELGALLALLEVDIGRAAGIKRRAESPPLPAVSKILSCKGTHLCSKPPSAPITAAIAKSSSTCIYRELQMPPGTDQNLYLQHLEVTLSPINTYCNAMIRMVSCRILPHHPGL